MMIILYGSRQYSILFCTKKNLDLWRNGWFWVWHNKYTKWSWNVLSYQKAKKLSKTVRIISKKTQKLTCIGSTHQKWYNFWDGIISQWIETKQIFLNSWVCNDIDKNKDSSTRFSFLEDIRKPAHYFEYWEIKVKNWAFILPLLYSFYYMIAK